MIEAAAYFHEYPYMAREAEGIIDGNAVLYSGTLALIKHKLGADTNPAINAKDLYEAVKVRPGVIARAKKPLDVQTHDDYIGMLTFSALQSGKEALEIYEYGKANRWSYVNVAYSLADWFNGQFWRLPGVVQHIKLCAKKAWSWFDIVMFCLSVMANAFTARDSTSGKILTWHMICMYEHKGDRSWLADAAVRFWKHRMLAMYKSGMSDIFGIYFGPDHIFTKYTVGVI